MFKPFIFRHFNLFIYNLKPPYLYAGINSLSANTNIEQGVQMREIMTNLSNIEKCKATAAKLAVDENIIVSRPSLFFE